MDLNYGMNIPGSAGYAGIPQQALNYQAPAGGKTGGPQPMDIKGPLAQMALGVMQQKLMPRQMSMGMAPAPMPSQARVGPLSFYGGAPRPGGGYGG